MSIPGGFQNFYKTPNTSGNMTRPLSADTIEQQIFPYHTFVILNSKLGNIEKQHTLVLNPQDFTQREPVRAQVVQTIGGAYVDDFGRGLPKVSLSGHTGWRLKQTPDGKELLDGWQAFKTLRSDIFRYFTDAKDSSRTFLRNPELELHWYNWGEDEYYEVQPTEEFQLQRSASNPLLYQYSWGFTCVRDLTSDKKNSPKAATFKLGSTTSARDAVQGLGVAVANLSALLAAMGE